MSVGTMVAYQGNMKDYLRSFNVPTCQTGHQESVDHHIVDLKD
jgi:hypothetical protein